MEGNAKIEAEDSIEVDARFQMLELHYFAPAGASIIVDLKLLARGYTAFLLL